MTVEIYTLDYCPYCKKALAFLDENKIEYKKIDITAEEDDMRQKLGEYYAIEGEVTLPQIVINKERIGGYDDMMQLVAAGEFFSKF